MSRKLLPFVCLILVSCAKSHALEPHIEFSAVSPDFGFPMRCLQGRTPLWSSAASSPLACIIPEKKAVLYTECGDIKDPYRRVALRSYNGKVLWSLDRVLPPMGDYQEFVVGGNTALCSGAGPTFGGTLPSDYEDVTHWNDYFKELPVTLLNLNNGSRVWDSNVGALGFPVWSNGRVFFAIRWDTAHARFPAPPAGKSHTPRWGSFPLWIEERSVKTRRCLWRARLAGQPPEDLRITAAGHHRARLVFSGDNWLFRAPHPHCVKALKRLNITVSLRYGTIPPSALEPRTYSRKEDE